VANSCDELNDWPDWWKAERLHRAAESGNLQEITSLLANGTPIDSFDDVACTPLHRAASAGQFAAVRCLIEAGADVNAHQEAMIGDTVLKTVASSCTLQMAKLLIEAGADPTIPGWMMLTALDYSAKREDGEGKQVHQLLLAAAQRRNPNWPRWREFC
jgi:ankyrin repeat protein